MKMKIETYYRILKHDPEGQLVKDSGMILSHSYVIQFLELLDGLFEGVDKYATDVNEAETRMVYADLFIEDSIKASAPAGDATYGIVVGTNAGPTAEDNENFKLDTKILHSGVGEAGKLNYQSTTITAAGIVGPNVDLDVSRAFINETGSTITVKEIGIIIKNVNESKYHLLLRDVVADEAVAAGLTLTVVYTLRTTA